VRLGSNRSAAAMRLVLQALFSATPYLHSALAGIVGANVGDDELDGPGAEATQLRRQWVLSFSGQEEHVWSWPLHSPGRIWAPELARLLEYSAICENEFAQTFCREQFGVIEWEVFRPSVGWTKLNLAGAVVEQTVERTIRTHRSAVPMSVLPFAQLVALRLEEAAPVAAGGAGVPVCHRIDPRHLLVNAGTQTLGSDGGALIRYAWSAVHAFCSYRLELQLTKREPAGFRWQRTFARATTSSKRSDETSSRAHVTRITLQ